MRKLTLDHPPELVEPGDPGHPAADAESARLEEDRKGQRHWKRWGPYLSERAWGTVREDYSRECKAWDYFTHDQARSRAYRWNEDGLGGISDRHQRICFALALWNERDPILKERLFGLTGDEGNHGEDVKEHYFYLDSTPTHSYMKWLYKYPQAPFPYAQLVDENRRRGRGEDEFELIETGVFNESRYFDVFVEYAKGDPEDILIEVTAVNRGPDPAPLHLVPTIWFRNTWSWSQGEEPPVLAASDGPDGVSVSIAEPTYGQRWLHCEGAPELLFTDNESNNERLFGVSGPRYAKDGINDAVVDGRADAINPARRGTKGSAHVHAMVPAGGQLRIRLTIDRQAVAELARRGIWSRVLLNIPTTPQRSGRVLRAVGSGL